VSPYANIADIRARHPAELVLLAADETTGVVDEARVVQAIIGASADINGILFRRYTSAELARLDTDSAEILRTYAIDIALYRVALSFARSSERLKETRDAAIEALKAIASGAGGLTFTGGSGAGDPVETGTPSAGSPNEVLLAGPERMFTRDRLRGL
jgi:phage gp36-like protein